MSNLDDWQEHQHADMADWQRKVDTVRSQLARITVDTSSRNGELGVTVDAQGHVRAIRLTPQAMRLGETRLAQTLLDTIQRAETDAAKRAQDTARPLTDDPRMIETMKTAQELTAPTQQPKRPGGSMTETQMDDYYLNRKWLKDRPT